MDGCSLLACSAYFHIAPNQDHQPRGGATYSELGLVSSIINQDNALWLCPQDNMLFFLIKLAFSKLALVCVKLSS